MCFNSQPATLTTDRQCIRHSGISFFAPPSLPPSMHNGFNALELYDYTSNYNAVQPEQTNRTRQQLPFVSYTTHFFVGIACFDTLHFENDINPQEHVLRSLRDTQPARKTHTHTVRHIRAVSVPKHAHHRALNDHRPLCNTSRANPPSSRHGRLQQFTCQWFRLTTTLGVLIIRVWCNIDILIFYPISYSRRTPYRRESRVQYSTPP